MKKSLFYTAAVGMLRNCKMEDDVTIYEMVEKRFGSEMAMYIVDAVTRGIYAADANTLTVDNALPAVKFLKSGRPISTLWTNRNDPSKNARLLPYYPHYVKSAEMAKWKAWNMKGGLGTLVNALENELEMRGVNVKTNSPISSIEKTDEGVILNETIKCEYLASSISPKALLPLLSNYSQGKGSISL